MLIYVRVEECEECVKSEEFKGSYNDYSHFLENALKKYHLKSLMSCVILVVNVMTIQVINLGDN